MPSTSLLTDTISPNGIEEYGHKYPINLTLFLALSPDYTFTKYYNSVSR